MTRNQSREYRIGMLAAFCFLMVTVLIGCAGVPSVSEAKFKDTIIIGGNRYISAEFLSEACNLTAQWDSITKILLLSKGEKEIRLMAESPVVLLDKTVRSMDTEAKLYQGGLAIPQSFAQRTIIPFLKEEQQRYVPDKLLRSKISGPIKTVIIDPGHGGKDPGAVGRGGLKEKDLVLAVAKRLKEKLSARGINVLMTREGDKFVSLDQRSRIANNEAKEADFFVSIHGNASHSKWTNGIEVFYLSEAIDDDLRSLAAAKDYDLCIKEDFSGTHTAAILWDLVYSENRRESIVLAEFTCRSLSANLTQKDRGTKPARFFVLKGTNIPAILIEVGFISNLREEKKLRTASYQDKISQAIADSIIRYNRSFTSLETRR